MWLSFLYYAVIPVILINFIGYVIAYKYQTDKLTDFSYSLSFITAVVLYWTFVQMSSPVFIFYSLLVLIWAFRLGGFLFYRIHKMGRDDRFDEMRKSAWDFSKFWMLQTISVLIIISPLFTIDASSEPSILTYIGAALCIIGLIIESAADHQKLQAKMRSSAKPWEIGGLWRKIRHPNYTGEILIWTALFLVVVPNLHGLQWLTIISPLWITFLLVKVSGIPLIEQKREPAYSDTAEYHDYVEQSWRLVPGVW